MEPKRRITTLKFSWVQSIYVNLVDSGLFISKELEEYYQLRDSQRILCKRELVCWDILIICMQKLKISESVQYDVNSVQYGPVGKITSWPRISHLIWGGRDTYPNLCWKLENALIPMALSVVLRPPIKVTASPWMLGCSSCRFSTGC